VSESLGTFFKDLTQNKASDRILILCFSEFGRRVKENGSRGTDHGTAEPLLLIGDKIRPGLVGQYPSLVNLDNGDLKHHIDFRQVYATVLEDWFRMSQKKVFQKPFEKLKLIQT
jgi:uncharacterized protein (DUF1501 family)